MLFDTSQSQGAGLWTSPQISLAIGEQITLSIPLDSIKEEHWQELRTQILDADGPVVLQASSLPAWPEQERTRLFQLGVEFHITLHTEHGQFADPFEAALAGMPDLTDIHSHEQALETAIHAAAVVHPDAADSAAAKINTRLKSLGVPKKHFRQLVSQIKGQDSAHADDESPVGAESLARAFLQSLQSGCNLQQNEPVLWFFQGDFYQWRAPLWQGVQEPLLQAQLTAFLQQHKVPGVTGRLLNDILHNLRGLTLLDCWDESMPFLVESEQPLQIRHVPYLVFPNGTVDLEPVISGAADKLKLQETTPRFFNETALDYPFDRKAKCKLWKKTVNELLPKKSKGDRRQQVLQEFMGYSLYAGCEFQKLLILIGDGGNGKSVVTETWQALLGPDNVSAVSLEALGQDHRQWALKGKYANFSGELTYLNRVNEGLLKQLVSGEPVDVNRKHRDPIKLRSHAKLIINTNEMPSIADGTRATWDRMIVIPFLERFRDTAKEDRQRASKLREELPGIFVWAIQGLTRLLKQQRFTTCDLCARYVQEHRQSSDSVQDFLATCCDKRQGYVLFSKQLYQLYKYFCERVGRKPVGDNEFGKRILRAGFEKKRDKAQANKYRPPIYVHLGLSPEGEHYWKQTAGDWTDADLSQHASALCSDIGYEKYPPD